MKNDLTVSRWLTLLLVGIVLCVGCTERDTQEPTEPTPPEPPPVVSEPQKFAIVQPTSNSTVEMQTIVVHGTGAQRGTTVEVDVLTDAWYPQDGTAQIYDDGRWTYSPCHLKGKGPYKQNHSIRGRLIRNNEQIDVAAVYQVAVR